MRRAIVSIIFLTLTAALPGAAGLESLQERISEFTLENGLKFILLEDHSVPIANFVTYVNIGCSDERIGIYGISHILEHLAFKGTSELGATDVEKEKKLYARMDALFEQIRKLENSPAPDRGELEKLRKQLLDLENEADALIVQNELDTVLSRNGGSGLNAFTNSDATVYLVSLPSNRLELWAYIESSRFADPVFRQFYKEKNVIMEERRMAVENNPIGKLVEEFLSVAFREQAYAVHTIGPMSNIRNITRQDVYDYFTGNYNASNMVIGVSGDIYPEQLRAIASRYFGKIPRGKKKQPSYTVDPPPVSKRTVTIYEDSQPVLIMGFRAPAISSPDFLKFSVLDNLLTSDRVSRLNKKLVVESKSAMMVGSFAGFPGNKYPGLYLVLALPNGDHTTGELQQVIMEEIKRLKEEPVPEEELESAKIRAKVNYLRGFKQNEYLLIDLLASEVLLGSWQKYFDQYGQIDKITAGDIREIVNDYLGEKSLVIGTIEKREEK